MEYMLVSTEKYNFFQSRNPGIWVLPIPGFGIPGLQSLLGMPDGRDECWFVSLPIDVTNTRQNN